MTNFENAGRLGNWLYELSATMAYAWDHNLEFTVPSVPSCGRVEFWNPCYTQHLVNPKWNPDLETVEIKERGYSYQPLPFEESWREKNIVLKGFWQSPRYWQHHRERVLAAFGFHWEPMAAQWCAIHVRRGDAVLHSQKHFLQSREWIEEQMAKFPGYIFRFFSDDLNWCRENFQNRGDCYFDMKAWNQNPSDPRPEVLDLIDASCCESLIGSASTFAIWIALLNRNPNRRCIFPKLWMKPGWESTTEETWLDVVPTGPGWERA